MGHAIPMAIRQNIIAHYKKGQSISSIARDFKVSRGTVYSFVNRYEQQGLKGLKPLYDHCGKSYPGVEDFIFRAVRCMRAWHPNWGADKICAEILRMRPTLEIPTVRTCYRWFKHNGQTPNLSKLPGLPRQWAKQLHEGWQIDAKEEIRIADGSKCCWLNIIDERSGTVIDPPVFPL